MLAISLSIDTIAQLAAIIVAVAVFVLQSRREQTLTQREIYQRLELAALDMMRFDTENKDLVSRFWNAEGAPDGDSPEYIFMEGYAGQILALFEMAIRFRQKGILQEDIFGAWIMWMYQITSAPCFEELWPDMRFHYLKSTRRIMEIGLEHAKASREGDYSEEEAQRRFFARMADEFNCPVIRHWLD